MSFDSPNGEVVVYAGEDGKPQIDVTFQGETVWLTQSQLIELFDSSMANVSEHIKNILHEDELGSTATVRKFRTVRMEGRREVARDIEHYNLDMIISLGYRVKSSISTKFRIYLSQFCQALNSFQRMFVPRYSILGVRK